MLNFTETCKTLLKNTVSPMLDSIGYFDLSLKKYTLGKKTWLVIMYHRIVSNSNDDPYRLGMCVSESQFDKQLDYFKNKFNVIAVNEFIDRTNNNQPVPDKALSITFDDGYVDNLENAVPILKKHGLPASIYISTGGIANNSPFWWDKVIYLYSNLHPHTINLEDIGIKSNLEINSGSIKDLQLILAELWKMKLDDALESISLLEEKTQNNNNTHLLPARLNDNEINYLSESGYEIGAHTISHQNLSLLDRQGLIDDIQGSKLYLEEICGCPIKGFAYPSGYYNKQVKSIVKESGFLYGLSTIRGINYNFPDKYLIYRVGAPNTNLADFKRCLLDSYKNM